MKNTGSDEFVSVSCGFESRTHIIEYGSPSVREAERPCDQLEGIECKRVVISHATPIFKSISISSIIPH
jgi:hypothetical protein